MRQNWDKTRLKSEKWIKFIYYPNGYRQESITRIEGRNRTNAFKKWCEDNAGPWMVHVVDASQYVCVAFADEKDALLCRLAFEEMRLT